MSGPGNNSGLGQTRPSRSRARSRGRPLAMLAVLLLAWTSGRAMVWEAPWPLTEGLSAPIFASDTPADRLASIETPTQSPVAPKTQTWQGFAPLPPVTAMRVEGLDADTSEGVGNVAGPPVFAPMQNKATPAGHQLVWMAAMSRLPLPMSVQQSFAQASSATPQPVPPLPNAATGSKRWSADAWAYWRQNSNSALVSQGRGPTYGASQLGGVLNYRLAPTASRDPRIFVRAYRALVDGGESEVSAGLSARPLEKLPLRAHAELRATQRRGDAGVELRPSAFVTTELPPIDLPLSARAEIYAQAGYVGGDDATAFADGQFHILRDVGQFDLAKVSLGAAAWGGAQKGAERVDFGPSVRVDMTIGSVPARLSVDYRERVAGSAQPDSGAAVTLSTSF